MASTSSKQNENTDSGSTGSTGGGGGGGSSRGGKGNKHSNASASATGDSWLAKTPAAAVGVPVDADMQVRGVEIMIRIIIIRDIQTDRGNVIRESESERKKKGE